LRQVAIDPHAGQAIDQGAAGQPQPGEINRR
jgi:hypothetical protein